MISRFHSLTYLEQAVHADLLLCLILSAVYSMQVQCIFASYVLVIITATGFGAFHPAKSEFCTVCPYCHCLSHNYS